MLENIEVRGFENDKRLGDSIFQMKSSLKFNIQNYPFLNQIGVVPFFYFQGGLSVEKNQQKYQPYFLGSTGLGLSLALNKTLTLELLCNLAQAQTMPRREPVGFQIRLGLFDWQFLYYDLHIWNIEK